MAADLTGIENVHEFFTQHYLDELLVADLKELESSWSAQPGKSPPERLASLSRPFLRALSEAAKLGRAEDLYELSHEVQVGLAEALGYPYQHGQHLVLEGGRALPALHRVDRGGQPYLLVVEGRFTDEATGALDVALVPSQLTAPLRELGLTYPLEPLAKLIAEAFALEAHPRWIVVLAGADVFLAERARWGRGRHLRFDLAELLGRRDKTALAITAALLCREALAPGEGAPLHDTLDENSHKHAYGVSSDLKYAARKAVELLGNEWVHYQRTVKKRALYGDRVARELTEECLIYLYRLLFLFYAEARASELRSLPMNSEEYRHGYSLEALRDLELVPLSTPEARDGYFLHESLDALFRLVNQGWPLERQPELNLLGEPDVFERGFEIGGVHSPLFDARLTPRLSSVKLRNSVLQEILRLLSLSREARGGKAGKKTWGRGRISYAQLGINQLGAVYEGLLSYTGFFAREPLYEVHQADAKLDETAQAFFVPESELERYAEAELTFEDERGDKTRRPYAPGTFIFRLAGRDRETSASYYTPEVLTDCLVKYALKELLDGGMESEVTPSPREGAGGWGQSNEEEAARITPSDRESARFTPSDQEAARFTPSPREGAGGWGRLEADQILDLTICEPAMGSGAFLVEAIDQLADAYLQRKQQERSETLDPERYALEKQKVATFIATHRCYGVDLNPMAARLAGVSLWLATMHQGQEAPWFGARLAVGNSLVGARLAVWDASDLATDEPLKKELTKLLKKHGGKHDLEEHVEKLLAIAKDAPDAVAAVRAVFAEAKRQWAIEDQERDDASEAAPDRDSARRAQLAKDLKKAIADFALPRHHRKPPAPLSAKDVVEGKRPPRSVYHFLLPDAGMSPFDKDKAVEQLVPSDVEKLKAWRKTLTAKYDKPSIERLVRLSDRVDALYARYVDDRRAALERCRASAPVWGRASEPAPALPIAERMKSLEALRAEGMPYARLKAAMDLWAAQWAWPLRDAATLPTRERWWSELEKLLGVEPSELLTLEKQLELLPSIPPPPPDEEDEPELAPERDVPAVVADVVARLRPHHWELEFAEVFVDGGGFDLIVGNPPWIRLDWNEQGILSDLDPRIALDGLSANETAKQRARVLGISGVDAYVREAELVQGTQAFLSARQCYPLLQGVRTNLYKCFITRGWELGSERGVEALIHQPGIFDDPAGNRLRGAMLQRARHVYRFQNWLSLFRDVMITRQFALSVSRAAAGRAPDVWTISNLFHPRTVHECWSHDGAGVVPGIKSDDNQFEVRGHRSRLVRVDDAALRLFVALFEPGSLPREARIPIVHSREVLAVLRRLADHPHRLRDLGDGVFGTMMWNETLAQQDGTIRRDTRDPRDKSEWILSGPHFYVGTPLFKTPRPGCRNPRDYEPIDIDTIADDYLPRTNYAPAVAPTQYTARAPRFLGAPVTERYRHVHRTMVSITGERTLTPAWIPPGAGHIDLVFSIAAADTPLLMSWSAMAASLPVDFLMRTTGKGHARRDVSWQLPAPRGDGHPARAMRARFLRLNCLTTHYADLWNELWPTCADAPGWTLDDPRLSPWPEPETRWHRHAAVRNAFERRWALVEIDALAALELGLTIDELCTLYRTQFPILFKNEQDTWYDQNGRIVFTVNPGLAGVGLDRKTFEAWQQALAQGTPPPEGADPTRYTPPFETRDRESDIRHTYRLFCTRS